MGRAPATGQPQLVFIDARSVAAAWANSFRGGGVEAIRRYGFSQTHFCALHNVHKVKRVVVALRATASSLTVGGGGSYGMHVLNQRATRKWLSLQSALLRASVLLAAHLTRGDCVFLHCSDGWDRTPQMSSLAQLIVDGHYRTARGFALLVEKEWVAFGHRFQLRHELGQPLFLQFLDAVYQMLLQQPEAFEFTSHLLDDLAALHDGRTRPHAGDEAASAPTRAPFDANCDRQRARPTAATVWEQLLHDGASVYRNPLYQPAFGLLKPAFDAAKLRLWGTVLISPSSSCAPPSNSCWSACVAEPNDGRELMIDSSWEMRTHEPRLPAKTKATDEEQGTELGAV